MKEKSIQYEDWVCEAPAFDPVKSSHHHLFVGLDACVFHLHFQLEYSEEQIRKITSLSELLLTKMLDKIIARIVAYEHGHDQTVFN